MMNAFDLFCHVKFHLCFENLKSTKHIILTGHVAHFHPARLIIYECHPPLAAAQVSGNWHWAMYITEDVLKDFGCSVCSVWEGSIVLFFFKTWPAEMGKNRVREQFKALSKVPYDDMMGTKVIHLPM